MSKTVDYYFSLESPWSYLGDARFKAIAARHGAEIRYRPVNYGEIFAKTGGLPVGQRAPARQAYRLVELERWRERLGVTLNLRPRHFPVPERPAARLTIAADLAGADVGRLAGALMAACWAGERDVSNEETLKAVAAECGMDGPALIEAAAGEEPGRLYDAYTAEALETGVFGAPTYVYRDEMFWGQDRLDFLDRALAG